MDKTALPFLILGLFVIFETRKMHIGSFSNPGPGLFPLLLGVILLISSLTSLFISNLGKVPRLSEATSLRNVIYVVGILLIFRFGLPVFGYNITTFLIFVLLLKIVGGQKWFKTIVYSIIFTSGSYLVFVKGFAIQFPKGIFRF